MGYSWDIFFMENRFVCNVTVFQVDLTKVRAGPDRTGSGSLLPVWPGAFYLRGQRPSTCVVRGLLSCEDDLGSLEGLGDMKMMI